MNLRYIRAIRIPTTIPRTYIPVMTIPPCFGKNAFTKNAYIGSFAVQLINGVRRIVIFLSLSLGRVRDDITAGTVQPNPMRSGTMLLPERPIFLRSLSMKNATLAIYPLSSRSDKKKNITTTIGRKLSTLPTPANIPSMIRLCITALTLRDIRNSCVRVAR